MSGSDQEIARQVLAGDTKAFARLVDRHKDKAMTLALRMLKGREEAEEAVQDAFLRAHNALGRFEWKSSFATWFYRIVFNVCSTILSRRGEQVHVSLQDGDDLPPAELRDPGPTPDVSFESAEFHEAVREEIELLPAAYASVVTLFFMQEMSYSEIVEVTGMPLGTVKARLFRARTMLKEAILRRMETRAPQPGTQGIAAVFLS